MMEQGIFNLTLDKISFKGMSSENIIYIIKNNKNGGNIANNPDFNYVIELSLQNIELAKCLIERCKIDLGNNLFTILDYILKVEPNYEVNVDSLDILQIIESYLNAGNKYFVEDHISKLHNEDLLLPYKYDSSKTILDVMLEFDVDIDAYADFLLNDERALIILLNNEKFLNQLIRNINNEYVDFDFLNKLSKVKGGVLFSKFFSERSDELMFSQLYETMKFLYFRNGINLNNFFSYSMEKFPDGHTMADYILFFHNKGVNTNFDINKLDNAIVYYSKKNDPQLYQYVECYIRHYRIEPLNCLSDSQKMVMIDGKTIGEHIFQYNKAVNDFQIINELISNNEWGKLKEKIQQSDEHAFLFPCSYDKSKTILDVILEHNIYPNDNMILELLRYETAIHSFIKHGVFLEKILSLPESDLLSKYYCSDKTVLEEVIEKDSSMIEHVKKRAIDSVLLARFIIRNDLSFLIEVSKQCAKALIHNMTLEEQLNLQNLGIVSSLIDKHSVVILNNFDMEIADKYIDMIKEQVKNNPDILADIPNLKYRILDTIVEIIEADPSKFHLLGVKVGRAYLPKLISLAKNDVRFAKHLVENGNFEIIRFLSKEMLSEVLPFAYGNYENFNGIPSLAYSEPEVMDIVREYRPNYVNDDIIQKVSNLKKWMIEEMPQKLQGYFGILIDTKKVFEVIERTFVEESSMFNLDNIYNEGLDGYWSPDYNTSHILVHNYSKNLNATLLHESIHFVFAENSDKNRITGLNYVGTGINEAATELFTQDIMGELYNNRTDSSYYNATLCLRDLLNLGISGLNIDSFKIAYISHNHKEIENAIDTLAGNGFFQTKLLPAFDRAIIRGSDADDLVRLITNLKLLNQTKENEFCDNFDVGGRTR